MHDKCQANTLVASVRHTTEEMAFESDGQHMHTGRVRRFFFSDGQYALGRVLGVQKILLLQLPPREQDGALKKHLAQRQFDCGSCGEIRPKGPLARGPALLEGLWGGVC